MPGGEVRTVRVRIAGRVQGVGYRYWTERVAGELGLSGWVRNRRDGTVEAVVLGTAGRRCRDDRALPRRSAVGAGYVCRCRGGRSRTLARVRGAATA